MSGKCGAGAGDPFYTSPSNCNINAFSNLTSIIYLYNENMNLEMTIKKLGSVYKFRVGRATGNEHIFLFGLSTMYSNFGLRGTYKSNLSFFGRDKGISSFKICNSLNIHVQGLVIMDFAKVGNEEEVGGGYTVSKSLNISCT